MSLLGRTLLAGAGLGVFVTGAAMITMHYCSRIITERRASHFALIGGLLGLASFSVALIVG
jgi:hypothetical protein